MKSIPKTNISFNFYHWPTSTVLNRKVNTNINIKTTHLISLTFFSYFLSFDSHVFIFFVFCISSNYKCSHRKCSVKKGAIRNFAKFTGKHLCQSLFLIKLQAWSFAKFLRTPFLQNTSVRLLLQTKQYLVWHLFIIQKKAFKVIL